MASLFNLNHNLSSELDEKQDLVQPVSNTPVKTEHSKQLQQDLSTRQTGLSGALTAQLAVSPRSASLELSGDVSPNRVLNQEKLANVSSSLTEEIDNRPAVIASQQPSQSTASTSTPEQATSSGNNPIATLLAGYKWGVTTLTYSFYSGGSYYGSEAGLASVSEAVKTNVRYILENVIEPLINLNFVEVTDSSATNSYGQIRYLDSTSPNYAYAYYPFSTDANQGNGNDVAGDVFLNSGYDNSSDTNGFQSGIGSHGYTTLIHETLHALGLKHPGNYDGSGTGEGPFLPFNQDNSDNTVMGYNFTNTEPATPMAYDLLALQSLYGAKSFNASDTNYSFSSVSGYSDGVKTVGSSTSATKLTLWDSGGSDTLNFAGLESSPGYYFDLNEEGLLTKTAEINSETYQARSDSSNANYTANGAGTRIGFGVTIENAIGTTSNDTLLGNGAANGLTSGGGNDFLSGGAGNDVLAGGIGNDLLTGDAGNDWFLYATGTAYTPGSVGIDRLTDFGRAAGNTDKIALSSTTFNAGTSFANVATDALAAFSGAYITFSSGTGNLFYNQNGIEAGFGNGGQFANISNVSSLLATDFVIIA